ncbi:MAG: DAK2 domain-containing protein [Clostridia bacterium]|nr:DAK2 domain-containing protein [Clostridia bacterium]
MSRTINAAVFANMIVSGANNLNSKRGEIDALNVFPVPDGDTGTNMAMTFTSAAREIETNTYSTVSDVSEAAAKATLRGARGNSGVILSQIFRGISKGLSELSDATVLDFAAALQRGCDTAYRAVMKPTEGTILTVIRKMAKCAVEFEGAEFEDFFTAVIATGNETLDKTPDLLPQLKQAGVVDAGGKGLVTIFEGFLPALSGQSVSLAEIGAPKIASTVQSVPAAEEIKFAYCTEFIINKNGNGHNASNMRRLISPKGDSMLVIDEDDIVKVHIHTNHPGYVLEQAVKVGELVNIKIDNMRFQHNNIIQSAPREKKALGIVSVAAGEGIEKAFCEMGVDIIVSGGQTMNPSTEDILRAVSELNADNALVLPNNKNIILAAQQAQKISKTPIEVVESSTIPQGLCAMMSFSPQKELSENAVSMRKSLSKVKSVSVTYAVRDTKIDEKEIKSGDYLGMLDGKIVSVNKSVKNSALESVAAAADDDTEIITVFYGSDVTEKEASSLAAELEKAHPDCDICLKCGGQPVYYYIISVE